MHDPSTRLAVSGVQGGAIYAYPTAATTLSVNSTSFLYNTAGTQGGAVYFMSSGGDASSLSLYDVRFIGNTASTGGDDVYTTATIAFACHLLKGSSSSVVGGTCSLDTYSPTPSPTAVPTTVRPTHNLYPPY